MKEEKKRGINKTLDFKEQTAIVSRYKRTRTLQDNKHSTVHQTHDTTPGLKERTHSAFSHFYTVYETDVQGENKKVKAVSM